jgi:hypothetical protein
MTITWHDRPAFDTQLLQTATQQAAISFKKIRPTAKGDWSACKNPHRV